MSTTSRRRFLTGAAAATAGVAYAGVNGAAAAREIQTNPIDARVALSFFDWPRHAEKELRGNRHLACLLYGLVCVDVKSQELLLPNPAGVANVDAHNARLWVLKSSIADDQQFSAADKQDDINGIATGFTIEGCKIEIAALDAAGTVISETATSDLKWRNSKQQPWRDQKWVRSLKAQTGKSLIPVAQRGNRALVTSQVQLKGGRVTAVPPFSEQGQHAEWRSQLSGGTVVVAATTDSMLWTRPFAAVTNRIRVTFISATSTKTLLLNMPPSGLLAAITHSTDMAHSDPTKMTDSTAFARLLVGNDPSSFPVPELDSLQIPASAGSSDDVHCEGGRP